MTGLALITGAGRGIGLGVAQRLANEGWSVAIADLTLEAAQAGVKELSGSGHSAWQVDVSDEHSVEALFDGIEAAAGPIKAVVCNAGTVVMVDGERPALIDVTVDDWMRTHTVNALGTFLCCRALGRRRSVNPVAGARIVTVSSVAAQLGGYRASSTYISSKSAILGLTKAAAREFAPFGITVNCVAPGVIDAPMFHAVSPQSQASDAIQTLSKAIPVARLGTPDDIAGAVAFLLSPSASYITGATIDVNGGYRMA